ncbi:MAG: hypothetical protein ACLS4Z_01750 [Christensenellaceae bacterium]
MGHRTAWRVRVTTSIPAPLPDNDDRYERLEIQDALRSAMKDLSETNGGF